MLKAGCVCAVGALFVVLGTLVMAGPSAQAQGVLAFSAQVKAALPQSRIVEDAASPSRLCTSISSKSRRCFFTFHKECEKRGESKDHCTRLSGFCHGCTDAYATCKGAQNTAREKTRTASTNCATCNTAYDICIRRMVEQYGGKLITVK